jgi:tRNA A-37 threonylcarbamoyl transferase component Bud32
MAQQKAVEPAVDEVEDLIDELQPGAKLLKGQYTITRYINSGGFGITYLAKDSLDRDVVIKECFPSSVCRRSKVMVAARSRAHTAELRSVVQLFVREARNLAKIVHPNIVAVHQVFEDNGTAYMAIDFIDGLDLQQVIDGEGPRLTPDHIVRVTDKLLAAVGFIHDHDMLHRDISPDNVLIDQTGDPILIDFGAAREKASQSNRAMSALRVVKDGYSPQEFYIAGSEQGPWSDLYALGATLYHLISGEAPVNGQARLAALAEDRADPYVPLTGRFTDYPKGYLEAIDRAMSTLPKHRLQSASDWLAMYHGGPAPTAAVTLEAPAGVDDAVHRLVSDFKREDGAALTPPALAKVASRVPEPAAVAAQGGRGKSSAQLLAGIAAALVVVAAGYVMLGGGGNAPAPTTESAATETAAKAPETPAATPETVTAAETIPADTAPATASTETTVAEAEPPKPAEPAVAEPVEPVVAAETVAEAPVEATAPAVTEEASATAEAPAAEAAPAVTEEASATAEAPAAEAAPTEPSAATPVAEPAADPVAAPAVEETAVAVETPAAEPAAVPVGKPSANQISFAAWDVEIPFASDNRMIDGQRVAVITRVPPEVDLASAGDWLAPAVKIYAVNGTPIQSSGSITVAVMNAMAVDPDGKARVVVEYSDGAAQRKTGLLTVTAVRLVNLENGVGLRTSVVDGVWQTEVTGVTRPEVTTLRQGDILFRDKSTGIPLDGPSSVEKIIADLIGRGMTETEFSIIRDSKVGAARMQLTLDGGP